MMSRFYLPLAFGALCACDEGATTAKPGDTSRDAAEVADTDTGAGDAATSDTGTGDTTTSDTGAGDTTTSDTGTGDTTTSDTGTGDTFGDTGGPDTDTSTGPASTAGVLCNVSGSGDQRLVYNRMNPMTGSLTPIDEVLRYTFAWTCDATQRKLSGNGVPNHDVTNGRFASKLTAQTIALSVTLAPALAGKVTNVKEPGYALNSVKFDPATAGTCPDDATVHTDCDYGAGRDTWRMVATPGDVSPWRFDFGVDDNDAHVQPNGQYHYHGIPVALIEKLNPNHEDSMTLVGWATDGFPIYSLYGYADPTDASSGLVALRSSYRTIAEPPANRPSVQDFPLGHFESDWTWVAGSGDLDECNGRFGVTPEFPQGIYHYVLTETYPFVQRCVKGTSATGSGGPGGPGGPPPGQ